MGVGSGLYMYDVVIKRSRSLSLIRWVLVIRRLRIPKCIAIPRPCLSL